MEMSVELTLPQCRLVAVTDTRPDWADVGSLDPTRTWRGAAPVREQHGVGSELWPSRSRAAEALDAYSLHIRDFTNRRGSDVDSPIRHANPDQRTHTQEVPHRRAVPHRPDIHQRLLAAALQRQAGEPRRREPAPRQRQVAAFGTRTWELPPDSLERRYRA